MKGLNDYKKCTGCGACSQICPKNAIAMKPDDEGFLYPEINSSLCIDCDTCRKICPQNGKDYVNDSSVHFWGSKSVNPLYDDKKGSSLIVVNSEKGNYLIEKMKKVMDLTPVNREQAVKENHNLIEPTKENPKREEFFNRLNQGQDFITIMKDYRKGKSHSQIVRVLVTKVAPFLVEHKRKKVRKERQSGM